MLKDMNALHGHMIDLEQLQIDEESYTPHGAWASQEEKDLYFDLNVRASEFYTLAN